MWGFIKNKVSKMGFWDWGVLKIYSFSVGIVVGAFFPEQIKENIWVFVALIIITFLLLLNSLFIKNND